MTNELTKPWSGLAGGLPAFDRVRPSEFKAAVEIGLADYRRDLELIATNPEPPTFRNVHGALETAGDTLDRVLAYFHVWTSTLKDAAIRALEVEIEPRLAAVADEFIQDARIFAKIETVYEDSKKSDCRLSDEEKRVCWLRHVRFTLRGAGLDAAAKSRVADLNQRLSSLHLQFEDNVRIDEDEPAVVLDDRAQLDGLPESFVAAARVEADRRGLSGRYVVSNTRSSAEPVLTFARDRSVREATFRAWTARGERTNPPLAREILRLRDERARLFGFETHAHWKLADKMIKDPADALELLGKVWRPAVAQARHDVAAMQALIEREGGGFELAAWDYRYYAEKMRREQFDLDPDVLRPFLTLGNVRDAMFYVADRLYGLKFTPLGGVPVYHPDVTVYEVTRLRGATAETVGIFYLDPFARPGKSSGAWMNNFRAQRRTSQGRQIPIVANTSNFIKGVDGADATLSWDDARTMFHEFGHALHGLNSDVTYRAVQGTAVPTDYVEFPSHFHENFLGTDAVLARLKNADGESLPAAVISKIKAAEAFNAAFASVEFLSAAIVDMRLHVAGGDVDPQAVTARILSELGMPDQIVMRHRLAHFTHCFGSDAYSAGYYSYLWSDVMASDAFAAFNETGDPFDPAVAARLLEHVLSNGNRVDAAEGYRRFRGRDPEVGALLRARGFAKADTTAGGRA